MSGISFTQQIKLEFEGIKSDMSKKVTRAAILAWREAVNSTPVLTGNLRWNWRLSNSRRGSYVPRPSARAYPSRPNFRFRITKDRRVYLYNNAPYASFVDQGLGPGSRTPRHMLRRAIAVFEREMAK